MLRIISFLFTLIVMGKAQAGFIHYDIAGTITSISNTGVTSVQVGDQWSADLTILSSSSDLYPSNPTQGVYLVDWDWQLTIGSNIFRELGNAIGDINIRPAWNTVPEIEANISVATSQFLDGQQIQNFSIYLFNTLTPALDNDSLEGTLNYVMNPPLDSNLFALRLNFHTSIEGSIEEFSARRIPIPATGWLFLIGLLGLIPPNRRWCRY